MDNMEQSPEIKKLHKILTDLNEKRSQKARELGQISDQIDEVLAKIYDQQEREKV